MGSRLLNFLCSCFLVLYSGICGTQERENSVDNKHNDFIFNITTINGQVFVNWTASGPWDGADNVNMTVYFVINRLKSVNVVRQKIPVCRTSKLGNGTWIIKSLKGNLLTFCNETGLCGPFKKTVTSLVSSYWTADQDVLSCKIFTTCSSFEDVYGIEVKAVTNNKTLYSSYRDNLSIAAQNIPPDVTYVTYSEPDRRRGAFNMINIKWHYPSATLCGFGSDVSEDMRFVVRYYKLNRQNCVFVGERTVHFFNHSINVTVATRNYTKYMFYVAALSLRSNQTSQSWLLQSVPGLRRSGARIVFDSTHHLQGRMAHFSWHPDWDCSGRNLVQQAVFCDIGTKYCTPVAEVELVSNGTLRSLKHFSENLIRFCQQNSKYCALLSNDTDMVDAVWESSTREIRCTIFKQCIEYRGRFDVKILTYDITKTRKMDEEKLVCGGCALYEGIPSTPTNLRVVATGQTGVTLSWEYDKCEASSNYYDLRPYLHWKNDERANDRLVDHPYSRRDGSKVVYTFNITRLSPFTNYQIQLYVKTDYQKSPPTPYVAFQTREAAPLQSPYITGIFWQEDGRGVKLAWKFPEERNLQGIPKVMQIEIMNETNTRLFTRHLDGVSTTSTLLNVSDEEKCHLFRVRICNLHSLCSPFSKKLRFETPCRSEKPESRLLSGSDGSNTYAIIGFAGGAALVLVIILAIAYGHYRKRRKKSRLALPSLEDLPMEYGPDYFSVGQTSPLNDYDKLVDNKATDE